MWQIIVGVVVFGALAKNLVQTFSIERWAISLIFVGLAVVLYILNIILIKQFIQRNAPEFANNKQNNSGIQDWELTAGLGVVPKWVSRIGLWSISALITAVFPWIIAIFR